MSSDKPAIGDVGGGGAWARPADKLLAIADRFAGLYTEPRRVVARAEAEAEATEIATRADIKSTLARRALARILGDSIRHQDNVEAIVSGALEELPEVVSDDPVRDDWVTEFFDQCKNVADEQLQSLWSRLLADEVAVPGATHPSTLARLREMTRADAEAFERVCGLVLAFPGPEYGIPDDMASEWAGYQLRFDSRRACELGLLGLPSKWTFLVPEGAMIQYDGRCFVVANSEFRESASQLTLAGSGLYRAVLPPFEQEVPDWLTKMVLAEVALPPGAHRMTRRGRRPEGASEQ